MSDERTPIRQMSAAELMAFLARDSEYQARRQRLDAEFDEREKNLAAAERPLLDALARAGVSVKSVWDLVNTAEPYPEALPVLRAHVRDGSYPDRIREGIARALAVGLSVDYWYELKDLYLHASGSGARSGLAVALSAYPQSQHYKSLLEFMDMDSLGGSRVHFVEKIAELGGDEGIEFLRARRNNPDFGPEIEHVLRHAGREI